MKYRVKVKETLECHREIVVDVSDALLEDLLREEILGDAEAEMNRFEDISCIYRELDANGITVLERANDSLGYPSSVAFEIEALTPLKLP